MAVEKKGDSVADSASEKITEGKKLSFMADFVKRLVKEKPLGTAGAVITLLLLIVGIFADVLAPYGMNDTWVGGSLSPPSADFWFGTDNVGRDILSRVIIGARISVIVGLVATSISIVVSVTIGIVSGYFGGKIDLIIQRFVDTIMCIPGLILLMVMIAVVGAGMWQVILVIGLSYGIGGSRIIRGTVISAKQNVYVSAAAATGCSTLRILARHILPNIMAPIIVLFSIRVPAVVMVEASLSFLGFGIPPPTPSWGGMLSGSGREYMFMAPWMVIWPGLALAIVVFGVNMLGDAVRDLLDPRLRGGAGRFGVRAKKRQEKGNKQAVGLPVEE
jgi:peptide/nickel transport system permease protein